MFSHRTGGIILGSFVVASVSSLEILLDDSGRDVHPGTAWTEAQGKCAQAGHGGGFHHNNGVHKSESFATWNFNVAKDGCYWVEEFHPDMSLHTAGLVDQSKRAGQWNKLAKLPFYTTHPAAIDISAMGFDKFEASGVWAADAFRLTWHSETCRDEDVAQDEAVAPSENEAVEEAKEANLPLLQALVDVAEAKVIGSTLEPVSSCPATASRTFHHDALRKDQRAQATFHFDPPHDGCYLIEELHPQLEQCKASANTKVHVKYCKGLEASGTVDQTANAGQWTFLAALPFFAGHPGNVTLSNEGTAPGTLAVFNQVRFTWSGKSCRKVESHPRQAEIRMTVDFKNVADRLLEFGSTLRTKLADMAGVPEKTLRLTGLRSGSIIAELLVLPSFLDDPLAAGLSAGQAIEKLRTAVAENAADLCALIDPSLEGCNVEFKDLGVAQPSIWPVQKQRPQQQEDDKDEKKHGIYPMIIGWLAAAWFIFSIFAGLGYYMFKVCKRKFLKESTAANVDPTKAAESEATASLEKGEVAEVKKPAEDQSDNNSTVAPSSDKQSESSINGDAENASNVSFAVVKALSNQDI